MDAAPMEDSAQLATATAQDLALIPEMDDAMTQIARTTIKFTDKVASYTLKFMVFYAVLCVYVLNQLNSLPRCSRGRRCATPMLDPTQVDVLIHASLSGDVDTTVAPTYVARNASGNSFDATIPLNEDVRKGGAPLTAHVFLLPSRQGDWDWANDTSALSKAFFVGSAPLTVLRRVTSQRMKPRKLLKKDAYIDRDDVGSTASHWRFGRWPLVVRMLDGGDLDYQRAILEQQHHLGVGIRARQGRYFPVVHVDESLALATHALPISRNLSFPDPVLKLQVKTASPLHFGLRKTLASQLLQFAALAMPEAQVDELRWQISDRRVFRFAAQQLVSLVHVAFDYLAFSEDVGFYVGRETFHGISKASLVWNLVRDLILYLYLQEQEAGLVVLFGLMLALLSDFFKIQRVLKPALVIRPRFPFLFIVTAPLRTPPAKATAKYDKEATSHLYLATCPMLFGVALYSLVHDVHRTYYGWVVSSLADLVYYFGFVMMTPQLYINYKLQSVAHLPIKVFVYKIFNTFVDDVFAWVVKMPLKHRLMTLRDDVVFVVFLYQWWTYRIDTTRPNEYGFAADYGGVQAADASSSEDED